MELEPSSLTHSLQIHCIGLIGPRPNIIWADSNKIRYGITYHRSAIYYIDYTIQCYTIFSNYYFNYAMPIWNPIF